MFSMFRFLLVMVTLFFHIAVAFTALNFNNGENTQHLNFMI